MKLDDEQQRQMLLQIIGNFPIQGNMQQANQSIQVLSQLGRAVENAGLEAMVPCTVSTTQCGQ
jgi:hypothetical protein